MKIGIDIGGSHIGVGVIDRQNRLVDKRERDILKEELPQIKYIIINTILKFIEDLLISNKLTQNSIDLIGIATPGTPIDGVIYGMKNLNIEEFKIEEELRKYFSIRIIVRNDGKCAGLCEKAIGSLEPYEDAIFLSVGTGIGGAVFINNKLVTPKKYPGFEIGHMVIQKYGIDCKCGKKGCFEAYASIKKLKQEIRIALDLNDSISSQTIFELIRKDNRVSLILEEYIKDLSIGISNLINIFEPEAIAIGGSLVYIQDIILEKTSLYMRTQNLLYNKNNQTILLPAKFKNDAGMIGATVIG